MEIKAETKGGQIDIRCVSSKDVSLLAGYVANQLNVLFPAGDTQYDHELISEILPRALNRIAPILKSVRGFDDHLLNCFNSVHYATFLYLLANEAIKVNGGRELSDRFFLLNKALHSVDLAGGVPMPEVFFLCHTIGTMVGNTTYGNRLVIFQNVTIGRIEEARPKIGNNVVLYPNVVISGRTVIGDNSVVAAGVVVHNAVVPENVVVKRGGSGLEFFDRKKDYIGMYLV